MMWDELTEERRHAAVTAVAQVENGAGKCFCHGCMAVCEAMAKAVVESLPSPATQTVPWEPRDQWPTALQVEAWHGRGGWLMALHGPVELRVDHERDVIYAERDDGTCVRVWSSRSNLSAFGLMPTREGRPVSWAEVEKACAGRLNDA